MMDNSVRTMVRSLLLLAGLVPALAAWAADPTVPQQQPSTTAATPATRTTTQHAAGTAGTTQAKPDAKASGSKRNAAPSHYHPDRFAGRAGKYYELTWGVDSLNVKLVESGELVRFSYRVLDAQKAQVLNDKQNDASLIDPRAGVSLVVPTMEKVGQLRQSVPPEAGRSYWMTFSNKGRHVAKGDRVDVVIGTFKASFLVVD
jgi:hypothetical protein